ncbi:MAG: hypothetical protein M3Z23_01100, partial [Acidobacteriota bacterium]|nr:hypothetical protein [Acidobacteriota bacterium]
MKRFGLCFSLLPVLLVAGPREFGRAELDRAIRSKGIHLNVDAGVAQGLPESFTITGTRIMGADDRGLMYGLFEAAEQIDRDGRLHDFKGAPSTPIRGIRTFIHNAALERDWYYSHEYWDRYFTMLAHDRFNRFNLVFAHQTDYLAPPYPFWLDLPEFPTIKARNLTPVQRRRNLEMLQYISHSAVDHGIDFTLGVWEHNIQDYRNPPMRPMTEGLTDENIGPYSYAALKTILKLCPDISSVQMRTNNESGIHNDKQVDFYRNHVFRAIRDAGRPVILDLRGWAVAGGMVTAAGEVGIPVRLSTKYWAEDLGRPYQPAETYAGYSYINFLEKPRGYRFYWELWGLGSNRLLLWGSPDYVRRAVPTFGLSGSEGFEIDPPLAQKGFGNASEPWRIFTASQSRRVFWKWEFERYWLFYRLWGRIAYDPAVSSHVWMDELTRRFGAAAQDVMDAYSRASKVINEIVAVHLADPNMYIWPEINPGGLVDAYRQVLPSDWRAVASIPEAVENRLHGNASAKQTALATSAEFNDIAGSIEAAVDSAAKKIQPENREWLSTEPDFRVLALMARYHAHKQKAAYDLELFDRTADAATLADARRELTSGLGTWERLAALTDGLYPANMSFGPDDAGHWKDKLPYVRHDLETVKDREEVLARFGRFQAGFDFGGPVKSQARAAAYRADNYVLRNNVEPRFFPVDAQTRFTEELGYGWLADGARESAAIPLTPYLEVRAVARNPGNLPPDVLFRDYIKGRSPQRFAVKVAPGKYIVSLLHPDHSATELKLTAQAGRLEIPFPEGDWSVSGVVVKAILPPDAPALPPAPAVLPRPEMRHDKPSVASAGKPLALALSVSGDSRARRIRLYY